MEKTFPYTGSKISAPQRHCGDCQLCCKLLPVSELSKASGVRCKHAKHGNGCTIYNRRPHECAVYSCAWLAGIDGGQLSRPDRAHYVLDAEPDIIEVDARGDGKITKLPCIVIWADANFPDAHRDQNLRDFLAQFGESGYLIFVRYGNDGDGVSLIPPALTDGKGWVEHKVLPSGRETSPRELLDMFRFTSPDGS